MHIDFKRSDGFDNLAKPLLTFVFVVIAKMDFMRR